MKMKWAGVNDQPMKNSGAVNLALFAVIENYFRNIFSS